MNNTGKTVAITEFIFCSGEGREGRGETDKTGDKQDNFKEDSYKYKQSDIIERVASSQMQL